jgi:hypothetical protein
MLTVKPGYPEIASAAKTPLRNDMREVIYLYSL